MAPPWRPYGSFSIVQWPQMGPTFKPKRILKGSFEGFFKAFERPFKGLFLDVGAHPGQVLIKETNEKLPYGSFLFVAVLQLGPQGSLGSLGPQLHPKGSKEGSFKLFWFIFKASGLIHQRELDEDPFFCVS